MNSTWVMLGALVGVGVGGTLGTPLGKPAVLREEDTIIIPRWMNIGPNSAYDKFKIPVPDASTPVNVSIQFYVENLGNFQVTTMDYDLDIYFIEKWKDPRLRHSEKDCMSLNDRRILERIWLPDLYFANSKMAAYNEVTVPNFAFVVCPDGSVRYSVRIALKMTCQMNLKAYPFDVQHCNIKVLPYGSYVEKLKVKWSDSSPIAIDKDIMETDLKLMQTSVTYCNGTYYGKEYSCLLATFELRRTLSLSLIQIYVPTTFIVVISWISFWIDPSSVPGRVGLAVTTLLTLSTQAAAMTFQLPPVGYAKALDYWLGMCLAFLFATLIEFTVVNNYTRRWQSALRKHAPNSQDPTLSPRLLRQSMVDASMEDSFVTARLWPAESMLSEGDEGCRLTNRRTLTETALIPNGGPKFKLPTPSPPKSPPSLPRVTLEGAHLLRQRALKIDKISRWAFPLGFVLLTLLYWWFFVVLQ